MSNKIKSSTSLFNARNLLIEKKFNEAVVAYQRLIEAQPKNGELYLELSSCLISLGQIDEAVVVIKNGLQSIPKNLESACRLQLAQCYLSQHRFDEAASLYEEILRSNPSDLGAISGMVFIHLKDGYPSKALSIMEPLKSMYVDHPLFLVNYSLSQFECMNVNNALECLLEIIERFPDNKEAFSNALLLANYTVRHDEFLDRIKKKNSNPFPVLDSNLIKTPRNKKLRIGFVSGDFCLHPVGYFLLSILKGLKDYEVEIYAYSNSSRVDFLTTQIQSYCDKYIQILNFSVEQLISSMRSDNLDIMIDLAGHTAGNRLDIFANRVARVQASYLGFMESTLNPGIDYLITDEIHAPKEESAQYSEQLVYIPKCRFNFTPPIQAPSIEALPFSSNGYITFGCFSNVTKFSNDCLDLWAKVLLNVPDSRLKLRHKSLVDPNIQGEILKRFKMHAVPPGRIEFYGGHKYDTYLKAYSEVDVMLDSIPFSGATTSCESLWMGVPIITMHGNFPAARQTSSILSALGESEWIAHSADDYIQIAKDLPKQIERLYKFRLSIREKINKSALGNSTIFTKYFYDALLEMLKRSGF
ncbi:tetratricopeptide repeat protein [Polynucleobacter sp. JS-Polo-80-F4]|uniref:O-linked N-acetylglucosamine transferase, SPINDLY family protein n=1 Tax=Polynucleobacter sp. JS-Polo-80-F4 TaxID=2576918 RepID=UPI001C0B914F|nr:tetratricopeptide repeat protein [Polynucleobacter sp. JS-Polo-80-F4]